MVLWSLGRLLERDAYAQPHHTAISRRREQGDTSDSHSLDVHSLPPRLRCLRLSHLSMLTTR